MNEHGVITNKLGELLDKELSGSGLTVYHDHGPESEKVGEISAYFGKELHRDNKLAEVDIAILDQQKKVILLIEVEENDDRPKTVIGDVMSTLFADGIAFKSKQRDMHDDGATLIVRARNSKVGHKERMGEINNRIAQILGNPIINRLKIKKVSMELFQEPNDLKDEIMKELGSYMKNG
jgi:hypothetical protein